MHSKFLSHVQLSWPHGLCQAPLPTGLFRQEYWTGLLFLPPACSCVSCFGRWALYCTTWLLRHLMPFLRCQLMIVANESHKWDYCFAARSLQSCPTLCDPIDGSPPGSPVPGILQARTVEWVAISFSRDYCFSQGLSPIIAHWKNMLLSDIKYAFSMW